MKKAINEANGLAIYKRALRLMGNRFEISVVGSDNRIAEEQINLGIAEISRIESLLTTFNDTSETNRINVNAGLQPVKVDREVFDLIGRSLKLSRLTDGAFDITYGSIDKSLWNFDIHMKSLPDTQIASKSIKLINYKNIILDEEDLTVFLKEKGMRIGFGGIGKGYAADRARMIMKANGAESGVVNAAGDLTAWGNQPGGGKWTIGIANPDNPIEVFSRLSISDMAVATSGTYEKFVTIKGKGIRTISIPEPACLFPVSRA